MNRSFEPLGVPIPIPWLQYPNFRVCLAMYHQGGEITVFVLVASITICCSHVLFNYLLCVSQATSNGNGLHIPF